MKNLSKIRFLISDTPATTFLDHTLFSNLVARLIGSPVSSSCIQILGVPGPASTKNISSLKRKRKTEDCEAFPLHNKNLELVPARGYRKYRLCDYSTWLHRRVESSQNGSAAACRTAGS